MTQCDHRPHDDTKDDGTVTLTADQAAEVARRHGLTLSDAQALMLLADDEAHAETLAARFAPESEPDEPEALSDVARRMFSD